MRDPEKQKILDEMTEEQRYNATSVAQYRERWTFIKTLIAWRYLTHNEFPHEDREMQMILRAGVRRPQVIPHTVIKYIHEMSDKWFQIMINNSANRTVKWRFHIHIYRDKQELSQKGN